MGAFMTPSSVFAHPCHQHNASAPLLPSRVHYWCRYCRRSSGVGDRVTRVRARASSWAVEPYTSPVARRPSPVARRPSPVATHHFTSPMRMALTAAWVRSETCIL